MRGEGDLPLEESKYSKKLETLVDAQCKTLAQVYSSSDASSIPQMWCVYKENGMRVPDDVILCWGNIHRFPLDNERNHTVGAGVYYHFDYISNLQVDKWIQTTQLKKVNDSEQM
ncbi:hypothetical protein BN14_07971 [Rhizoctonia solani AG-1 IB]|uniref:Uncharacterized protein n=1 Tax=Thanatephorus cucumeris (strain AG1-IB / isolate 7/3/14) TaxID=1108050 RepID=M5C3F7_THACB|nr:hypothetical protein BN14_07971 [Rhizoctonia solani AG-1 IB]